MLLPFLLWILIVAASPGFGRRRLQILGLLAAPFTLAPLAAYFFVLPPPARGAALGLMRDYLTFVILLGSFHIIAGGIHLTVSAGGRRHRLLFLAAAGALANVISSVGASMILLRPWLRMNAGRKDARHVVFFIFIAANIGGALTPLGNPPLLLGFIKGLPFLWVAQHCWKPWALTMAVLLAAWAVLDWRGAPAQAPAGRRRIRIEGAHNFLFLAVIVAALLVPGPWGLCEAVMVVAAATAYASSDPEVRERNDFHLAPLWETALVFAAVFATMLPALDWLRANAGWVAGSPPSAARVYWGSGLLSSVLDNAPAYLAFAAALGGGQDWASVARQAPALVAALSVGAVYFGGLTYIGNGPNLLVKAVAERQGVRMPGFFSYLCKWAVPFWGPVLILAGLKFFPR